MLFRIKTFLNLSNLHEKKFKLNLENERKELSIWAQEEEEDDETNMLLHIIMNPKTPPGFQKIISELTEPGVKD